MLAEARPTTVGRPPLYTPLELCLCALLQAGNIHKSLLTLSCVIRGLADNQVTAQNTIDTMHCSNNCTAFHRQTYLHHCFSTYKVFGGCLQRHLPYRDSKLTRLLQPFLSGNSHMAIITTISPAAGKHGCWLIGVQSVRVWLTKPWQQLQSVSYWQCCRMNSEGSQGVCKFCYMQIFCFENSSTDVAFLPPALCYRFC